jgi:hypothetical protein
MHEYYKIKEPLQELFLENGLVLDVADMNVDYYGSVQSIFASDKFRFMIFWDGEEGFGGVEKYLGDGQWEMLEPTIPESKESVMVTKINALVDHIQRMF